MIALAVRRLRAPAIAATILAVVALRPGGYLPAMYVVQILPFFAIVIAGVTDEGVRLLKPQRSWWRWAILGVATVTALTLVLPRWYDGNRRALTTDDNAQYVAAATYLRDELPDPERATIVVDDVLWIDCVDAGFQREKVIWFYKLDLDTAVAKTLPDGWRDVDYIVSTPALRQDPGSLPTVTKLLTNSTPIATFGPQDGRIEIRRIDKEKP